MRSRGGFICESLDSLTSRLGEPNVELPDRGVYGWSANYDDTVFHIVVIHKEGRSVAEQLKSYGGTTLERDAITDFFARQLGHIGFIGRFIDSSSFVFQGVKLNFAAGTRIYLDDNQLVLCVWETIPNGSVSIYKGEGIKHRTALTVESLR